MFRLPQQYAKSISLIITILLFSHLIVLSYIAFLSYNWLENADPSLRIAINLWNNQYITDIYYNQTCQQGNYLFNGFFEGQLSHTLNQTSGNKTCINKSTCTYTKAIIDKDICKKQDFIRNITVVNNRVVQSENINNQLPIGLIYIANNSNCSLYFKQQQCIIQGYQSVDNSNQIFDNLQIRYKNIPIVDQSCAYQLDRFVQIQGYSNITFGLSIATMTFEFLFVVFMFLQTYNILNSEVTKLNLLFIVLFNILLWLHFRFIYNGIIRLNSSCAINDLDQLTALRIQKGQMQQQIVLLIICMSVSILAALSLIVCACLWSQPQQQNNQSIIDQTVKTESQQQDQNVKTPQILKCKDVTLGIYKSYKSIILDGKKQAHHGDKIKKVLNEQDRIEKSFGNDNSDENPSKSNMFRKKLERKYESDSDSDEQD